MKLESFVSNLILSAINQIVTSTNDSTAAIKKLLKQVSIRFFNEYRYAHNSKEAIAVIQAWWQSDSDRLELAINGVDNISIMINREDFIDRGGEMQITKLNAIEFYFRSGHLLAPGFAQTLICDLHDQKQIDAKVHHYLYEHSKHVISQIPDHLSRVPTLRQYLPRYEQVLTLPNHDRRKALEKVNRIKLYFTGLMDKRIDKISKSDLLDWLDSYRKPLTQREVDCSFDRFILADSTIKGAITTLRSAINTASNDDNIPFIIDKALYSKELTIHVSNEVDTFYPLEQELEMLENLLTRDRTNLEGIESDCLFSDYFTPLVLLCRLTGLRPKYARAIRLKDINFELGQITMMGKRQGKIKSRNAVKMDKTLASVLKE